jgi:hypothetical protein
MAGTLRDMKARIASELARADLTTQIANAITDAIGVYQKVRFRFNETIPDNAKNFSTVANRATYTSADLSDISTVQKFDYLLMKVGITLFQLKREDPVVVKLYNQTSQMIGQPGWWAYEGNEIIIAAIPDQAYVIYVGAFFVAAAPGSDTEANNPWMTDAEMLIRSRAKYEIARHVTRNDKMAQNMSPHPPQNNGGVVGAAWEAERILKKEANRVTGRSIIRATRF